MRKRQDLDSRIKMILSLEQSIADNTELIEMGESEGDQGIVTEAEKALFALKPRVAETEIETLLNVRELKAGLKIVEVPSFEANRIFGESNLRAIPDGWRVLKTIFRERLASAPYGELQ